MRGSPAPGAFIGDSSAWPFGSRQASSRSPPGKKEAVWPSSPMPSTTAENGIASAPAAAVTAASPASGVGAPVKSGTKVAAAAGPVSRPARRVAALERSEVSGTQRSSTRVTVTFDQSRLLPASAAKKRFGVRPPDSASEAAPRAAMSAAAPSATKSARASASRSGEA
ncbi:hypothetical protein A6302_01201 [Methylobrevis pamukkalensis]|uniref:Uncharacterized protein n=1 Tax=Methylobrevis pamukkalensis TaxID=1439726 RepID=A0A1E3H528_9HYPH|nr:hypothetical protein A6302_01201 [Methylobrevis pamukkalensis]